MSFYTRANVRLYKSKCPFIQEQMSVYIVCNTYYTRVSTCLKALKALKIIKSLSRGECLKLPYVLAKARTLLKLVPRFVGQFLVNPVVKSKSKSICNVFASLILFEKQKLQSSHPFGMLCIFRYEAKGSL